MSYSEWMATIGVGILLLAYLFMTVGVLRQRSVWYAFLNLIGASLACYASVLIDFFPFVVLEGSWAGVAGVALVRAVRHSG